jgi:DNA-binding TFAR19-related protein (PDSD5 family)
MMATTAASTAEREAKEHDKASKSQIVVVDLDEPQSSLRVKRLRKGRGKLMTRVERIVSDLVEAGTIKSTAQPVVIVVREIPPMPWSFADDDDDDDDDD